MEALDQERNALLNLISHQPDIDKTYLCAKDPYEPKYQLLMNKRKSIYSKHCNDSIAFIEYFHGMDNIYQNIDEYNADKKLKKLTVFHDMIIDMLIATDSH